MARSCTSTKIEPQDTVEWETFEGENFRGFQGLRAIHESFLCEIWGCATTTYDLFQAICESFFCEILTSYGSTKVFSLESFPLYGNPSAKIEPLENFPGNDATVYYVMHIG